MPPKFRVWLCTFVQRCRRMHEFLTKISGLVLCVCVCVCETGSSREHHQHVVAADGKWFGRAETFTDSPRPVDHQHSCT